MSCIKIVLLVVFLGEIAYNSTISGNFVTKKVVVQKNKLNLKHLAEVCIHHLYFNSNDYKTKGTHIKWNPRN